MLAGDPALPDSDPPGQEKQTSSGRNPQRDPSWRYFYHFHEAQRGMLFPAVDTGLGHFCLQNSVGAEGREIEGDVLSGRVPLAGSLT